MNACSFVIKGTHRTKHTKTASHMQLNNHTSSWKYHSKAPFQTQKGYAYMYIIITFHISSKIPFPSVVIQLHRSNGSIMPLWQAQLPPYPSPSSGMPPPPPKLQSDCWTIKVKSKNMQNEGFFTLSLCNFWNKDMNGGRTKRRARLPGMTVDCNVETRFEF